MNSKWHFWENRPCVHLFSSLLAKHKRLLRKEQSIRPPTLQIGTTLFAKDPIVFRASAQSAKDLSYFWNTHYQTSEWTVSYSEKHVYEMLQTATILGIRNTEGELVGTVASCPLPGTFVSQGEEIPQRFFQVECLVIHPTMRGKGLAGWLLAWLDYCTSTEDSVIHTWVRESLHIRKLPQRTIVPFRKMITAQIRYASIAGRPHPEKVDAIPWPKIHDLMHAIRASDNYGFDMMYIPEESPTVSWWRVEIPDHPYCAMVVGIASSHRRRFKQRIFYVVFTCFVRTRPDDILELKDPFWYEEDNYCPYIQDCIEAAAYAQKCDILTISNASTCGDPFLKKWGNWTMSERKRKLYFYNFSHPSFTNGSVLWPVV